MASEQLSELSIIDLWDLELIGIHDPVELKSKAEKDEQAQIHFNKTVLRNSDGRYKVALPWINGNQDIPNNFETLKQHYVEIIEGKYVRHIRQHVQTVAGRRYNSSCGYRC